MLGLKADWSLEVFDRYFTIGDYAGGEARWCPGCGDHGVLAAAQRILRDEQQKPELSVCVSGIGCSSRMPHYLGTYGFHGLHGRALPLACGIKSRRPDLDVWVATGDGDCFSIGTAHWIHALRYNMDMTLMVFDNAIYGLTKAQTSPTSPIGFKTNTHPFGAIIEPLNPLTVTLGITNISFVAQVVDWNPPLLYETLKAAYRHRGTGFVRIIQRCPVYAEQVSKALQEDPSRFLLLEHEQGIPIAANLERQFPHRTEHDPGDLVRMSQKPIPGLCDWRIGKWRFPDSFIFNGLPPLKIAVHPWTASGVACGDTLLAGEGWQGEGESMASLRYG